MRKFFFSGTLIYFLCGAAWLLTGSLIIEIIDKSTPSVDLSYLQHYKGVIFLISTVTVLFFLLRAHSKHILKIENNYHKLFEGTPGATYVMDKFSLNILEVNNVMVEKYGYTREQLLSMTALDIRPEKERVALKEYLQSEHEEGHETGVWLHQKKNGDTFFVLISHHSIKFQDKDAYIVIAIDIDSNIRNEEKLRKIAWSNSHEIRRPLSNILGLVDLVKETPPDKPADQKLIEMLSISANELDDIIKKINFDYINDTKDHH